MEELYGGERLFRQNLEALFRNTTTFWNESTNKFDYRFEWAMGEGDDNLVIYDIKSGVKSQAEYNVYKDKAYGTLNTEKYDFVLFLALRCTKVDSLVAVAEQVSSQLYRPILRKGMIFLQRNGRKKVHTVI